MEKVYMLVTEEEIDSETVSILAGHALTKDAAMRRAEEIARGGVECEVYECKKIGTMEPSSQWVKA